jgi:hypothetical protein
LKKGESVAIYKDKLMIMKWKDKKDILWAPLIMKNWPKLGFEANTPKVVNDNLMEGAMLIWQGTIAL